jgi:hypothetical protein
MKLRENLKNYLPITFAIIVITLFISIGIICIIGVKPFKNKDIGIGLIIYGVFAGFYTGLSLGCLLAYLIEKCLPNKQSNLIMN